MLDFRENWVFLKLKNGGSEDNFFIRVLKILIDFNDSGVNGFKDLLGNGKNRSLMIWFDDFNSFLMLLL